MVSIVHDLALVEEEAGSQKKGVRYEVQKGYKGKSTGINAGELTRFMSCESRTTALRGFSFFSGLGTPAIEFAESTSIEWLFCTPTRVNILC